MNLFQSKGVIDKWMTSDRISHWWRRPSGYHCLGWDDIALYRIMRKTEGRSQVIFSYIPGENEILQEFVEDPMGIFEARYYQSGRIDNPTGGVVILYIADIQPKATWANKISATHYDASAITVYLQASCILLKEV